MHQQKLIILISSLEKEMLDNCRKYLSANLRSTSEEFRLFDYIWQSKNNWQSKRLEIERTINTVKQGASIKKFESLMSALTIRIEQFLINHDLETPQRQFENQLRLAHFYKRKGLNKFFQQAQRKLVAILKRMPKIDADYHWYQLQHLHQVYFSNLVINNVVTLEKMMGELDAFYQEKKLVYEIEAQNLRRLNVQKNIKKKAVNPRITKEVLTQQLNLLQDKNETTFLALKTILFKEIDNFAKEDAYRLLNYLINFCAPKIKTGSIDYILHINDLYQLGLNSKISLLNGKVSEKDFLNRIIVSGYFPANSPDEINQLIQNCEQIVSTKNKEGIQKVSYALYHFYQGNYSIAYDYTRQPTISRIHTNLYYRTELIKLACQYRLMKEYAHPESLIINCRNYFKNKPKGLSDGTILGALNLIKIIEMLWFNVASSKIIAFKDSCQYLTHRFWVNKEIEQYT